MSKKMAIIGLLWIAIFDFLWQKNQIMTQKNFFLQNTTHNGGSIKNPMNPKRKTKLYTAKKKFFLHILHISKNIVNQSPKITNY